MRSFAIPSVTALCLSLLACAGSEASSPEDGPAPPAQQASVANEGAAASSSPSAPADPTQGPSSDGGAALPEGDAGLASPGSDAGSNEGGVKQIPLPKFGKLHASASTGELCQFAVDGTAKGTSTSLDLTVLPGVTTVSCTRTDGSVATETIVVVANDTTTVLLDFAAPIPVLPGTLVAVAVGGTCTFSVNGAPKGTSDSLKLTIPAGTYSVTCKPTGGGTTLSRSVILKSGETAMAMFKLN